MKHKRFGFTLLEMAIFLAMTGALFVGIIVGTQGSIRQQKYNDSVQSFVNFWKDIYASVSNTQNYNGEQGRSDQAIYGKLVVFGQSIGLPSSSDFDQRMVFTYDVIGDATVSGTGTALEVLYNLGSVPKNYINVISYNGAAFSSGIAESYLPTWGAEIQDENGELFKGSILVVRHPRSGVINTYKNSSVVKVNEILNNIAGGTTETKVNNFLRNELFDKYQKPLFEIGDVNFCVNSEDIGMNLKRRVDVKLVENARNVAGIEVLSFDNNDNKCRR